MHLLLCITSFLFSIFSTAVMSYISMATPIGPWMEATLVLIGTLIFKGIFRVAQSMQLFSIGIAAASGALGGIIATACAFSFPTFFFLDAPLFNVVFEKPVYFCALITGLVIVAGSVAFFLVSIWEKRFLDDATMPFPIGTMVYKMIAAQDQMKKALELVAGCIFSVITSCIQLIFRAIPNKITLVPALRYYGIQIPSIFIQLDTLPMLLAIGFVTGHVIALPLFVGVLSKIICVDPLQHLFFSTMTNSNFVLAFCSGMVLQGAIMSFMDIPKLVYTYIKSLFSKTRSVSASGNTIQQVFSYIKNPYAVSVLLCIFFFSYLKFSLFSQIYLIIGAVVCTYQLLVIAGKAGIAPLGRFATFIMVPGLVMFGYNPLQVTIVATFIELCGGIAVDLMFGRKMAQYAEISSKTIQRYQWLGLIVSACSVGIIFWFLIDHFGLGTAELFAQRAQSRALLINAYSFNYIVVMLGFIFSWCLKFTKVNSVLVLGGLLMPFDYSLPLIIGGLSTRLVRDKEAYYPFWSGVFAASSIMMIIRTLF